MPDATPETSFVSIGIRLPADMHADLLRLAAESERSLAAEARVAIRAHIDAGDVPLRDAA